MFGVGGFAVILAKTSGGGVFSASNGTCAINISKRMNVYARLLETKIWPLHFVWVVRLLCDSDQVYANFVQQRLWREFLLGPLPFDFNSASSSDSDSDIHVYSGMFPIGQFPYGKASVWRWLLTFWGIDMRGVPGNSTWKLCPMWRHRACTSQPNILYVIIKFLGPFTPFDHTHFW